MSLTARILSALALLDCCSPVCWAWRSSLPSRWCGERMSGRAWTWRVRRRRARTGRCRPMPGSPAAPGDRHHQPPGRWRRGSDDRTLGPATHGVL